MKGWTMKNVAWMLELYRVQNEDKTLRRGFSVKVRPRKDV